MEGEEWGKRGVVGGERTLDEVCERQEMAGEEEQVTTQECLYTVHGHGTGDNTRVCVYSTRTCYIVITPSVSECLTWPELQNINQSINSQ